MKNKILPKTHPRFSHHYVEFVGVVTVPWTRRYSLELTHKGQHYAHDARNAKVGQKALLIKRIPSPRGWPVSYAVHLVELGANHWHYRFYAERQQKDIPHPEINLKGSNGIRRFLFLQ